MSEWWTYSLSDFLLFSPRVYSRLFELYNASVWPAQILSLALGVAMVLMLLRPVRGGGRLIPVILGVQWLWIAWAFFFERYAAINWAAIYIAPAFALEGALLIAAGVAGPGLRFVRRGGRGFAAGLVLFTAALVLYPLIAPLLQRPWAAAEIFGIAPDPTAVATLAILALAAGRLRVGLMVIPVLWCVVTGATLWTMETGDFVVAPLGAALAIAVALLARR